MKRILILTAVVMTTFLALPYPVMADWFSKVINSVKDQGTSVVSQTSLSQTKIGEGIKEALKVGIRRAIETVGQTDGFMNNETIRISFPQNLSTLEKGLRLTGMGEHLDEFVLSMNRAAEHAIPKGTDIFIDAVADMTLEDAKSILNGSDTAATSYFKEKTIPKLKVLLKPSIEQSLQEFNVTKRYQDLMATYNNIPFSKNLPIFDPQEYVLNQGLEGLFVMIAREEQKIRTDPTARTTDLLKQVFNPS